MNLHEALTRLKQAPTDDGGEVALGACGASEDYLTSILVSPATRAGYFHVSLLMGEFDSIDGTEEGVPFAHLGALLDALVLCHVHWEVSRMSRVSLQDHLATSAGLTVPILVDLERHL